MKKIILFLIIPALSFAQTKITLNHEKLKFIEKASTFDDSSVNSIRKSIMELDSIQNVGSLNSLLQKKMQSPHEVMIYYHTPVQIIIEANEKFKIDNNNYKFDNGIGEVSFDLNNLKNVNHNSNNKIISKVIYGNDTYDSIPIQKKIFEGFFKDSVLQKKLIVEYKIPKSIEMNTDTVDVTYQEIKFLVNKGRLFFQNNELKFTNNEVTNKKIDSLIVKNKKIELEKGLELELNGVKTFVSKKNNSFELKNKWFNEVTNNSKVYKNETQEYDEVLKKMDKAISTVENKYKETKKDSTEIRKQNFRNQIIAEYYNQTISSYKGINMEALGSLKFLFESIDKELTKNNFGTIDTTTVCGCRNKFFLSGNENILDDISTLYKKSHDENKEWINNWLWYTKGDTTLNPLGFDAQLINSIPTRTKELALLKEQVDDYEKFITRPNSNIQSSFFETYKSAKEKYLRKLDTLTIIQKINSTLKKDEFLYKYEIPKVSDVNKINWYENFDASNNYEFSNLGNKPKNFKRPVNIHKDDELIVAIHNLKKGDDVNLKSTESSFEVVSIIESQITNPLMNNFTKALSSVNGGTGGTLSTNKSDEKSFDKNRLTKCGFVPMDSITCKNKFGLDTTGIVKKYNTAKSQLEWLLQQTTPISELNLVEDPEPAYRTKYLYPERKLKLENDKKVTYELITNAKSDSLVGSKSYVKYNTVNFLPLVGISFIPQSRYNSIYEENQGFITDKYYNNFEIFAGVKWYPFGVNRSSDRKTSKYIRKELKSGKCINKGGFNSNFLRGNSWTNRISFTLALGTSRKFLRNYNIGLGWDPIPGFNLQAGYNIYIQNTYEISNGLIKDQSIKPKGAFYTGISVDLGIASQISKLFIKSK
ncbi:MAG TPA: hypothetical protein VK175_00725 [Leadbetterella sp.]|nr:hypothetical protein [Leadbetterella sp.]